MASTIEPAPLLDIEAFDAFRATRPPGERWELLEGELIAMAGGTETHEQIVADLGYAIKGAANDRECRTYFGGMYVRSAEKDDSLLAPDIVVRCGPALGSRTSIDDPVIVVEVLSPSTAKYDRGRKLEIYQSIPTMQQVALVYQGERRVEAYDRARAGGDPENPWGDYELLTSEDDVLVLPAIGFEIALRAVYAGVDLPAPRAAAR